jgi:hypothetical protein
MIDPINNQIQTDALEVASKLKEQIVQADKYNDQPITADQKIAAGRVIEGLLDTAHSTTHQETGEKMAEALKSVMGDASIGDILKETRRSDRKPWEKEED